MKDENNKGVCLVVGAGDDTGAAIAKTFALMASKLAL